MPEIGARRDLEHSTSTDEYKLRTEVIPLFIEEAKDEDRPVVSGYCIDEDSTRVREQAVGINELTNKAELHVIDLSYLPIESMQNRNTTETGSETIYYSIFSEDLIRWSFNLDSNVIRDLDGAYVPSLTFGIDENGEAYVRRTRFDMLEHLDRTKTYEGHYDELKQAIFNIIGHSRLKNDANLGEMELVLTEDLSEAVSAKYASSIFELKGDSPRFHAPLRFGRDYYNQRILGSLARGDLLSAIKLTEKFDEPVAEVIQQSVAYVAIAESGKGGKVEDKEFKTIANFWFEPTDEATDVMKFFFPEKYELDDITSEEIVIEAMQALRRSDMPSTVTIGSIDRMAEERNALLDFMDFDKRELQSLISRIRKTRR
jgi:hypothetical protein